MDLKQLQQEHREWLHHNFPNQKPHDALLGLAEEVGELAHAHLKHEQKIRGYDNDQYGEEAGDAIADILIYLCSYCTTNGFDLNGIITTVWPQVRARDWVKFPTDGLNL